MTALFNFIPSAKLAHFLRNVQYMQVILNKNAEWSQYQISKLKMGQNVDSICDALQKKVSRCITDSLV